MQPELKAALNFCHNLPSPTGVALRVIELAQNPDTDISTAAQVISLDMALSTRILRVANSPLYATHRRAGNLQQALTILGLNTSLSLALGVSMLEGLRTAFPPTPLHERIWRHSIITALAARSLGQACGANRLDELLLSGLLQDIGVLALLHCASEQYLPLVEQNLEKDTLILAEREALGCDHAEVGAWLAHEWHLPDYLQKAIAQSPSPAHDKDTFNSCVKLSAVIAKIWFAEDPIVAMQNASAMIRQALQLDADSIDQILQNIDATLPEIAALFEVRIEKPAQLESIMQNAMELSALRNLRELQDIASARQHTDELENHARHLAEQAKRDALTGVYNRHQLDQTLDHEFESCLRHGWPLSIAFIDLDDFKHINDTHGHLVGDEVLRNFAHTIQRLLRSSDTIARYGGEEFLIVLPNTDETTAIQVIQRLLKETTDYAMAQKFDKALHITFSAGLATQDSKLPFKDVQSLIKAADEALYWSKHHGRNQVSAYSAIKPTAQQAQNYR